MTKTSLLLFIATLCATLCTAQPRYDFARLQMEHLGRGLVAVRTHPDSVAIQWRLLRDDPAGLAFQVYRDGKPLNSRPLTDATFVRDYLPAGQSADYEVRPLTPTPADTLAGNRCHLPADAPTGYLEIPLDRPDGGITPAGEAYTYTPNDATAADTDGDGQLEIILKWEPTNAHDNAHNGYTGNVYIDCYELLPQHSSGTRTSADSTHRLWRIDLGRNIRAGAHYTQIIAYDFDGDGCAEIALKTADGTIDGRGRTIGNPQADWRNPQGRILDGPEYLTLFDGRDGHALTTIGYLPARGDTQAWGDNYGNRCDRFLACVAYLDGTRPSLVTCRGYYTRTAIVAYQWDGAQLTPQWIFDTTDPRWQAYAGQGNHNLRVGDIDGDGCDEIIYGSMTVDHNGTGLYTTGLGHGDALHMTAFLPADSSLQVWACHENRRSGTTLRDAATGRILFQIPSTDDVGRCLAADIDPNNPGLEMWSSRTHGILNAQGRNIAPDAKLPINMAIWWDGDLLRELLDGTTVSKYNPADQRAHPILHMTGATSTNGTKSTPSLAADLLGDWREEILMPAATADTLRLYVTPHPTACRATTFLADPIYRISLATQNVGYNQPCQPGFYFGPDAPPRQQ